ncbi:glycogen debranching enzyme [Halobacteroides halobius DSM 5150]|uniref:Glycogen debranching enzyme n=1 Tax=Halobacteroides halobius (strain ATCC 35273 / DSM 5150 / MD-1) TaxID=748449 RepID=L0K8Z7_HALHC|nr:glycogen debranching N-terminal domain-containing protein [Halobacteroides halobius]AGB41491.1 glycogen debranching enzyme [Halobacteroides halobius DSM 5150]
MDYLTVKEGNIFIVSDQLGNIRADDKGYGLYTFDTRFLNKLELTINDRAPILLSAAEEENYINQIHLANQEFESHGQQVAKETVGIKRSRFINELLYEKIELNNYNNFSVELELEFKVGADYKDILDIRDFADMEYTNEVGLEEKEDRLTFSYQGSDDITRRTKIACQPKPLEISKERIKYNLTLSAKESKEVYLYITPELKEEEIEIKDYDLALEELKESYQNWEVQGTEIKTDNQEFNQLLKRSNLDLRTLMADFGQGDFPVAGIPWYVCPFGRDGLITALQMMLLNPEIAKSTLRTLAQYQGQEVNPSRDEEPGKIFHELRFGEMANTGVTPHDPYYGTADATPLFLILVAKYYRWTSDLSLVKELLPAIKKALHWIDEYGDQDGDGFIEYEASPELGYEVQVWKDSQDSMRHEYGAIANSPMAVSEVQGYAYRAKKDLAPILEQLDEVELSRQLEQEAQELKANFEAKFWLEKREFYALALDQNKDPLASITSDIGHCLWSGIIADDKAQQVVDRLVADDMSSGYGIRTMSKEDEGYNPISYHNGSVWPHDNSLIVAGMKSYGYSHAANQITNELLSASKNFEYYRLPELYCGFDKKEGIVDYPIACSPQAWAAATPYLLLEAILGLNVNLPENKVYLDPTLPDNLTTIEIRGLTLGTQQLDFKVVQKNEEIGVSLLSDSELEIIIK